MFGIDDTDDPADESCWIKANPAMSENRPTMSFMRRQYADMKLQPETLIDFISKHLNRQLGAAITYFDMMAIATPWEEIATDFFDAVGGVDLAETTDLYRTDIVLTGNSDICRLTLLPRASSPATAKKTSRTIRA